MVAGKVKNGFVAVRPPGHHAGRKGEPQLIATLAPAGHDSRCSGGVGQGFCLVNTAAVAAKHATEEHELGRVSVLDVDLHHVSMPLLVSPILLL